MILINTIAVLVYSAFTQQIRLSLTQKAYEISKLLYLNTLLSE
jgi:hypothetical protein